MNPEIKTQWIATLRSGDYKQTKQVLKDDDGYCCLGVLCDVVDPIAWRPNMTIEGDPIPGSYEHGGARSYLPTVVWDGVGMSTTSEQTLTDMNDRDNKSFAEIADWIEVNL